MQAWKKSPSDDDKRDKIEAGGGLQALDTASGTSLAVDGITIATSITIPVAIAMTGAVSATKVFGC